MCDATCLDDDSCIIECVGSGFTTCADACDEDNDGWGVPVMQEKEDCMTRCAISACNTATTDDTAKTLSCHYALLATRRSNDLCAEMCAAETDNSAACKAGCLAATTVENREVLRRGSSMCDELGAAYSLGHVNGQYTRGEQAFHDASAPSGSKNEYIRLWTQANGQAVSPMRAAYVTACRVAMFDMPAMCELSYTEAGCLLPCHWNGAACVAGDSSCANEDVNNDGAVDAEDLTRLLAAFNRTGCWGGW